MEITKARHLRKAQVHSASLPYNLIQPLLDKTRQQERIRVILKHWLALEALVGDSLKSAMTTKAV